MIDALFWYFWLQIFALGGAFLCAGWLRNLPDRGYGIGKAIGLLIGGFVYWLLVNFGLAPNTTGGVLLAAALLYAGGIAAWRRWGDPVDLASIKRLTLPPYVLLIEASFAIAFAACCVLRAHNPEIFEAGGEKYMESMMLNAIVRSSSFPPNDAWLSGYSISYYYFGYVLMAMLTKLSGAAPGVAFNLGGAGYFALAISSAAGVGYDLWASHRIALGQKVRGAVTAGVLTALMVCVMGNMGGLMGAAWCGKWLPNSAWQWLDIRDLGNPEKQVRCEGLRPAEWWQWWWDWSRVVKDHYYPSGDYAEVITEVPAFSYVLGDNHPHVMALPFDIAVIGVALALASRSIGAPKSKPAAESIERAVDGESASSGQATAPGIRDSWGNPFEWIGLALTAILVGGLSFMNTWDFPVFGALAAAGYLIGRHRARVKFWPGLVLTGAMFALAYLAYLPFYAAFSSQANGIGVNALNGTRLIQFAMLYAPFLLAFAGFLVWSLTAFGSARKILGQTAVLALIGTATALLAFAALAFFSPQGRVFMTELRATGQAQGVPAAMITQLVTARLSAPWTPLILALGAAMCGALAWMWIDSIADGADRADGAGAAEPADQGEGKTGRTLSPAHVVALLCFGGGALLTLAPEFVFIRDVFNSRLNTVFKLYYQAWTVWAVASGFAVMALLTAPKRIFAGIAGGVLAIVCAGLLFPYMAAMAKTNDFTHPATLDGAAYIAQFRPEDHAMIDWFNQNVRNDPVILERSGGAYEVEGRISAFTGLPTPLGWRGHQRQWRGTDQYGSEREEAVNAIYTSTDASQTQQSLKALKIAYVVVGQSERSAYTPEQLAKFDQICSTAFQSGASVIYRCGK